MSNSDINVNIDINIRPHKPAEHIEFEVKVDHDAQMQERIASFLEAATDSLGTYVVFNGTDNCYYVTRRSLYEDIMTVNGCIGPEDLANISMVVIVKYEDGRYEVLKDRFGVLYE